jgi:hypothetical protein
MLLCWQRAELEDVALGDSDDSNEPDGDSSPAEQDTAYEEYQGYVHPFTSL